MKKYLGDVYVDAGLIWIGDPCYVIGKDASSDQLDWSEFCERLFKQEALVTNRRSQGYEPLGKGVGIAHSTAWGDGSYPVFGYYDGDGVPIKLEVYLGDLPEDEDY